MNYQYSINNKAQDTQIGEHEVHKLGCHKFPGDRTYLGEFDNCNLAVKEAKNKFPQWVVDGCVHCCKEAHNI